ncbi:hypothetical protein PIB30_017582 [Stylosanthes scabra]|uniref:Uncharacterized protein n=1 Tax=Stylosanthes scabra TaxID=79078 RepID=A0ABU6U8L9_9FABA|nr:hypothetical protein [Stylosanthes scabra]
MMAPTPTDSNHDEHQVVNTQVMYSGNNHVGLFQYNHCIIILNGKKSPANFSGGTLNSGNYSADQNRYYTTNNHHSPTFNTSGRYFHGDGGGYVPTRSNKDYYHGVSDTEVDIVKLQLSQATEKYKKQVSQATEWHKNSQDIVSVAYYHQVRK